MSEQRARRLLVPTFWSTTPDARGFFNFAREYYRHALDFSLDITLSFLGYRTDIDRETKIHILKSLDHALEFFTAVYDKIATPLVYLYERWTTMNMEEKSQYDEELKKLYIEYKNRVREAMMTVERGADATTHKESVQEKVQGNPSTDRT